MTPVIAVAALLASLPPGPIQEPVRSGDAAVSEQVAPGMVLAGARRGCRPGMRWSTYHRKCVLWLPFPPS